MRCLPGIETRERERESENEERLVNEEVDCCDLCERKEHSFCEVIYGNGNCFNWRLILLPWNSREIDIVRVSHNSFVFCFSILNPLVEIKTYTNCHSITHTQNSLGMLEVVGKYVTMTMSPKKRRSSSLSSRWHDNAPPAPPHQLEPILELIVSKKFHNVACNGILALLLWVSRRSCLKFGNNKQVKWHALKLECLMNNLVEERNSIGHIPTKL